MDTKLRLMDPAERLPALLLAAVVTFLVFAAINLGFTARAAGLAGPLNVPSANLSLDSGV
jgi:hypothetical protein